MEAILPLMVSYWITSKLNSTLKKKIDHICNETEVRVESMFMEMSVAVGGEFWKTVGNANKVSNIDKIWGTGWN